MSNIRADVPQPKISLGTNIFKKLVLQSDIIVDKSLLIKSILKNTAEVLFDH